MAMHAPKLFRAALAGLAWLLSGAACGADNCDEIRTQIEAKIRAAGVTNFSLTTVDAAAAGAGKVIGSCGMGARKILYLPGPTAAGAPRAGAAASAAKRRSPPTPASEILTECKDGSASVGGNCKQ